MPRLHTLSHAQYVLINRLATPLGAFIILIVIGRHSDQLLGEYALIMTFYYIMQMLPLLGLTPYVMREVARRPDFAGRYFTTIGAMSLVGCIAVDALCYAFLHAIDYPAAIDSGIGVMAILIFPGILLFIAEIIFMSLQRTRPVAEVAISENVVRVILSLLALTHGGELMALLLIFLATRFGALLAYVAMMRRDGILKGIPLPDRDLFRKTLGVLPSFLIGALFFVLFSRMDFVALSLFERVETIGYYAIGYRLFDIGLIILTALIMAIFPWVARKFAGARNRFRIAVRNIVLLFAAGLLFVAAAGTILGEYYVQVFFVRQYPQPVLLTQLFMAGLFICGMDFVISGILHASDRQTWDTRAAAVGGVFNAILLFGLIPVYGIYGALIAKVASTLIQAGFKYRWLRSDRTMILTQAELWRLALIIAACAAVTASLASAGVGLRVVGVALLGLAIIPSLFLATGLLQPLRLLRFYWHLRGTVDVHSLANLVNNVVADARLRNKILRKSGARQQRAFDPVLSSWACFQVAWHLQRNGRTGLAGPLLALAQWLGAGSTPPPPATTSRSADFRSKADK